MEATGECCHPGNLLTEVAMGFCLTASAKLSIHKQQTNVKLIFVYTGTTGGGKTVECCHPEVSLYDQHHLKMSG